MTRSLGGDWVLAQDALFESGRDVAPDLDGENDSCRKKQRSDGDMDDRRDHHGKFGLRGVYSPHDARDEG